jgi:hypothetical protein
MERKNHLKHGTAGKVECDFAFDELVGQQGHLSQERLVEEQTDVARNRVETGRGSYHLEAVTVIIHGFNDRRSSMNLGSLFL